MSSSHLKVYNEPLPVDEPLPLELAAGDERRMAALCDAFTQATGWQLCYAAGRSAGEHVASNLPGGDPILEWSAPVNPGVGATPGHLRIDLAAELELLQAGDEQSPLGSGVGGALVSTRRSAEILAEHLASLVNELTETRTALQHSQAELAVAAPYLVRPDADTVLSERFEAIVRGGAQGLGCHASGMYLLDDATTELRLRASWGLPVSRYQDHRNLEEATADLEALVGHAVVLDNRNLFELWNMPEPEFEAGICVPISSSTTLLGTLWLFSAARREFSDSDTNLVEIVAGRLAVEIEREMLLRERRVPGRPT